MRSMKTGHPSSLPIYIEDADDVVQQALLFTAQVHDTTIRIPHED